MGDNQGNIVISQLGSTQARLHGISSDATLIRDSNANPSNNSTDFPRDIHTRALLLRTSMSWIFEASVVSKKPIVDH